jgi:hypothetical protein
MHTVGVLLFGLVVAAIVTVIVVLRRGAERMKIRGALRARGATLADDGSALRVSQTPNLPGVGREPRWSAHLDGDPEISFYQLGHGPLVLAWQSARALDVAFALTSRRAPNPSPAEYRLLDPRQLGVDRALAYTLESNGGWLLTTDLPRAFVALFGNQRGCHFLYERGLAYVFSTDTSWHDVDEAVRIVRDLETALAAAPDV